MHRLAGVKRPAHTSMADADEARLTSSAFCSTPGGRCETAWLSSWRLVQDEEASEPEPEPDSDEQDPLEEGGLRRASLGDLSPEPSAKRRRRSPATARAEREAAKARAAAAADRSSSEPGASDPAGVPHQQMGRLPL